MSAAPYHHGDLRSALLERAEEALREKGPSELSLRALAREIGVSPAAPSRHFRSRRALLDELAVLGYDRLWQELQSSQGRDEAFPVRLAAVVRAYIAFTAANPALHDVMSALKYDGDETAAVQTARRRTDQIARSLLKSGQEGGYVREGPLDVVGVPLSAALQGLAAVLLSGSVPEARHEDALACTIDLLLRGYAP